MFIRKTINSFVYGSLLTFSGASFSQDSDTTSQFQLGSDYLFGHSTYEIGGLACNTDGCSRFFFPISKLEFPIDMLLATIGFRKQLPWANFQVSVSKSVTDKTGIFKDSDYVNAPGSLDIYSESKSNSRAFIASVSLEKPFFHALSGKTLAYGADLTIQDFSFEVKDTNQISNVPGFCTCYSPGLTITYDITYFIPSVYIRLPFRTGKNSSFEFRHAISPLTFAYDKDNHVARQKISSGELYGFSNTFDATTIYHMTKSLDLKLNLHAIRIVTEGTQTQVQQGTPDTEIDEKVDSTQWSVSFTLQSSF